MRRLVGSLLVGLLLGCQGRDPGPKEATPAAEPDAGARANVAAEPARGNWPSFRGADASGVADGQNAPTVWNAATMENVRWKTPIPGLGLSSPVVWGDRLFVTTAVSLGDKAEFRNEAGRPYGKQGDVKAVRDPQVHSWRIYCLCKRTGEILWEKVAHEGVPKTGRHPKATQANCTVATDGRHVVAYFGSHGLYCYDVTGNLLWSQDLGVITAGFERTKDQWGTASSPIIYKNLAIVQCDSYGQDSFLAAYDLARGKQVWRTARDEITTWSTPTVYRGKDGDELITNGSNRIRGYDPATGKELWSLSGNSRIAVPTPIVGDGLIYVTSGYPIPGIRPIYAIRPGARGDISLEEGKSANDFVAWSVTRDGAYMPTQLLYRGILYNLHDTGILSAYDAKTGKQLYKERVHGVFSASPVAADGHLYLASENGNVYLLKAGPTFERVRANPMGEVCMATPAISDGMIFVRTLHHLYGIGK